MRSEPQGSVRRVRATLTAVLFIVLASAAGTAAFMLNERRPARLADLPGLPASPPVAPDPRPPEPAPARIRWRRSVPVGSPAAGRLARGVRLPAEGRAFFTWDPVKRRSPNRPWRRWGTDGVIRAVLGVARGYRRAHPRAARLAIGDLSRPRGGDFGPRYGYIGHASHQNGLDVDVYYPRADGRERAPRGASQIDRARSQELVDRFLAAGAQVIFVGPSTGLSGPPDRVQALVNHDNHLHARFGP